MSTREKPKPRPVSSRTRSSAAAWPVAEAVDHVHVVPGGEQVDERMAADIAGAAGDQDPQRPAHARPPIRRSSSQALIRQARLFQCGSIGSPWARPRISSVSAP